jgi:hypothetical protein
MDILGIAQQGLSMAQDQFDKAANRIARPAPPESEDVVSLLSAKNQVEANLNVLKVADDIQKKTLDILA